METGNRKSPLIKFIPEFVDIFPSLFCNIQNLYIQYLSALCPLANRKTWEGDSVFGYLINTGNDFDLYYAIQHKLK